MTDVTIVRWTPESIQEAIQKPTKLLANPDWLAYVQQLGGIAQLYKYMSTMPLKEKEQRLLDTLLQYPGASVDSYTQLLHIHPATFHRHQKQLFERLAICLNSHKSENSHPDFMKYDNLSKEIAKLNSISIIGRDQEQLLIDNLIYKKENRLITLTGLGGVGKTTLAISMIPILKNIFDHGIVFIRLQEITNQLEALRFLSKELGIIELNKHSLLQQIQEYLHSKSILLIIDNLEHLSSFIHTIDSIIQNTAYVKFIITSRVPLRLLYEKVIVVNPLAAPEENIYNWQEIAEYPAIKLFYQRASAIDINFKITNQNAMSISKICRMLSGIPLAIEIVVAYIRYLSLEELYENIKQSQLTLNTSFSNQEARHQNLAIVINWSFQQLDPETQACFIMLGCSRGYAWSYAAAQAWTQLDHTSLNRCLQRLIDHQLIQTTAYNQTIRYSMHMVVAVFVEKLFQESPDYNAVNQRYYTYYAEHMQQMAQNIQNTSLKAPIFEAIKQEYPHYRATLEWYLQQSTGNQALEIIRSLWRFWLAQGFAVEGYAWCQQLLTSQTLSTFDMARLNLITGNIARLQGALVAASTLFRRTLALWQELEHSEGIAWGLANCGLTAVMLGDYPEATQYLNQGIAHTEQHQHTAIQAICYGNLTELTLEQADYANATHYAQQALIYWQTQHDLWGQATVLRYQAIIHFEQQHFKQSKDLFDTAYQLALLAGDQSLIGMLATHLGAFEVHNSSLPQAYQWLYQALTIHQQLGDLCELARSLEYLACYYTKTQAYERALKCLSRSDSLHRQTQRQRSVYEQEQFETLLARSKQYLGSDWIGIWYPAQQQSIEMQILAQP